MNILSDIKNPVADIGVAPVGSLKETAALLGDSLGGITFVEDSEGRYDEFPAYVASNKNASFALLGVPPEELDLRDNPTQDFTLMIRPAAALPAGQKADVTVLVVGHINDGGHLRAWSLK